jgi:hypothetical protein
MSTVTIQSGGMVIKDPSDSRVYTFDWSTNNLGVGVTITTSTWTITPIKPSTTDTALTKDNESILAGTRTTQVRLLAGTLNQVYEIANRIVTNESPSQTKERSFYVLIQNQ